MPKSSSTNEWERRHKPIDERAESSIELPKGVDEQLEINISERKFSISLKGFEPNAITEIKELLQSKNIDLLDLIRAYLNSVQSKCELESKIDVINQKLSHTLAQKSIQNTLQDFVENNVNNSDTNDTADTLDEIATKDSLADFKNDSFGDFSGNSSEAYGAFGEIGGFGEFGILGGISLHDRREIDELISEEELDRIMAQKENEYADEIDEDKQSNNHNNADTANNKTQQTNNETKSNTQTPNDTESNKPISNEAKSSKTQNDEKSKEIQNTAQVDFARLNQAQFDFGNVDTQALQNETQKPLNTQNIAQAKTQEKTPPNFDFLADSATLRPISRPKKKKLDTTKQDLSSSLDSSVKSRFGAITKFFKS